MAMTNTQNKEIMKLKLENAKQKEIIRIQAEIINSYKELTDVTGGKWSVYCGNEEIFD